MSLADGVEKQSDIRRQEPAVSHLRKVPIGIADQFGSIKIGSRPVALTRPSNDDITHLINLDAINPRPGSLADTPNLSPQISTKKVERVLMTASFPPRNKWRIVAACMWALSCGISDAAPGALLPHIEKTYNINYTVVSLMWMLNAVGFILVAILSSKVQEWFGKHKSVPFGCFCSIIMLSMVSSGGPFPLVVCGFFFGGIGLAVVLAQLNIFLSRLDKSSKYLGFFHGCYGFGATISPLYSTAMVNNGIKWNYTYLIALGLMVVNLLNTYFAYMGADEDLSQWDHDEETKNLIEKSAGETEEGVGLQDLGTHITTVRDQESAFDADKKSVMKLALQNKITWLISIFVLVYQGGEVSLGGWIVSYLLDYRNVSNSYGYVLSGFFGGLTIGRLALTRSLHKAFGARKTIIVLSLLSIVFVILAWVVPSSIGVGVFVSLAGVTIGPTYPLMITVVSVILPRKIQVVSLTIMTAFGSSGGALFPFLTGLVAELVGTFVVLPIFIGCYSVVLATWLMLPNVEQKLLPADASKWAKFVSRVW